MRYSVKPRVLTGQGAASDAPVLAGIQRLRSTRSETWLASYEARAIGNGWPAAPAEGEPTNSTEPSPVQDEASLAEWRTRWGKNATVLQALAELEPLLPGGLPPELLAAPGELLRGARLALISDIHGNYEALQRVLEDIESRACDRIVCLGDLVDGGPENSRVLAAIQSRGIPAVRGNHDFGEALGLSREECCYLQGLPDGLTQQGMHFTHISPRRRKQGLSNPIEAWNVFDEFPHQITFVGHLHVPLLYSQRSERFGEAGVLGFEYGTPVPLRTDERYIVCVGAVAYGRDGLGKARYAIYDQAEGTLEMRAVEAPMLGKDYTIKYRIQETDS